MLSQELTLELKDILKDDFNQTLPIEEVKEIATIFVGYFDLLVKINSQKGGEKI